MESNSLIDWVNSINDPYCLLANCVTDLQDGVVLCHLVCMACCNQDDSSKMKELVNYESGTDP
jgi:hypothetical protein